MALLALDRFVANPKQIWLYLAIVVLILFGAQPFFALAGANTTDIVVLEVMHLIVAGAAYYFLIMRD